MVVVKAFGNGEHSDLLVGVVVVLQEGLRLSVNLAQLA